MEISSNTNIPDEELEEIEEDENELYNYYSQRCENSPAHNLINHYLALKALKNEKLK